MNRKVGNTVRKRYTGMESDTWGWNVEGEEDIMMNEIENDDVNVRLLGGDHNEPRASNTNRSMPRTTSSSDLIKEERKYKYSLVSVLFIGVCLIMLVNIGLGYRKCEGDTHDKDQGSNTQKIKNDYCYDKSTKSLFPWQKYRLPTYAIPVSYNVFLHPNLTQDNVFGSVNIIVTIKQNTNTIILHSRGQKITEVEIKENTEKAKSKVVQRMMFCEKNEMVSLDFGETLAKGKSYNIFLEFSGNLTFVLDGFYLSKYKKPSGKELVIGTTQFESVDARAAFPCFDEPNFKAKFSLSIVRTTEYHTLSNMPFTTEDYWTDLKVDKFKTSVKMSTYLVAFLISDFQKISQKMSKVEVSIYAPPDKIHQCQFALEFAVNVLSYYEKLFQIPFPLPKLDLAAIPDFAAGAMENWGLVTYRETALLYDPAVSSIFDQEWVAKVIAHELSHQWFGNLVTMEWWNDLWLNEGFASYMEYVGVDKVEPSWNYMSVFALGHMQRAMSTDSSRYTHPISVSVDSKEEIEEMFDSISYDKGACVISMLANYIGHEDFQNGVNIYLKKYEYSNAVNQDLITAISEASEIKGIQTMMNTWTNMPGFPIVDVTVKDNQVTLKQSRFLYKTKIDDQDIQIGSNWQIPLLYVTNQSPYKPTRFFMNSTTVTFSVPKPGFTWIKFNHNQTGYYKVNYDDKMWTNLIDQMTNNHEVMTISNRASLLSDAFSAGALSTLEYDHIFNLVAYLKKETSYAPVTVALGRLLSIKNIIKYHFDDSLVNLLNSYIIDLLLPLYNKLAWKDKSKLGRDEAKLQSQVVRTVCGCGYELCVNEALSRFELWKQNSSNLNSDDASTVFAAASEHGTLEDWEAMWDKFVNSTDANEKQKLLFAVTIIENFKKISFLQTELLSGENIKSQDQSMVIRGLTTHVMGASYTWSFVKQHWAEFIKVNPVAQFGMRSIVSNCMSHVMEPSDVEGAKSFFETKGISNYKYIKQAIETSQINWYWTQKNYATIKKYFEDNANRWPIKLN